MPLTSQAQAQAKYDACVNRLKVLDFTSDVAVTAWFSKILDVNTRGDITRQPQAILAAFAKHGLVPGMNTGSRYDASNRKSVALYLIGQGLCCIKDPGISPNALLLKMIPEWQAKFQTSRAPGRARKR